MFAYLMNFDSEAETLMLRWMNANLRYIHLFEYKTPTFDSQHNQASVL